MNHPAFLRVALASFIAVISSSALGAEAHAFLVPADDSASLENQKQIRSLMDAGAAACAKGDWQAAHDAVSKAWNLKQLPMIAASLGYIELNLGRYREAAEHLKYFLDRAPDKYPEQRSSAEQQLEEARKHVALVEVSTNVSGVRVLVDDTEVGYAPLPDHLYLEPGEHTFKVIGPGYQPATQTISLQAGNASTILFRLKVEAPPVLAAPAPATAGSFELQAPSAYPRSKTRTWALIGGSAATAVSLGLGIGYAFHAESLEHDGDAISAVIVSASGDVPAKSQCFQPSGDLKLLCDRLRSTRLDQTRATNTSRGALIVAGTLGAATVATYLLWPILFPSQSKTAAHRVGVAPWLEGKTQGIRLVTAF